MDETYEDDLNLCISCLFENKLSLYMAHIMTSSTNEPYYDKQDEIFRRKRLSTGANFVHVYLEIWDKGILKFNKFSM